VPKKSKKTLKKNADFSKKHFTLYMLAFAIVGAFTLWVSFAAPHNGGGKPSGGGTISLGMVTDQNSDGLSNRGDEITFTVSTTATDRPFVGVRCYQGTNFVYDGYAGYFESALYSKNFTLSNPYWAEGTAAGCTARLFYYDKRGGQHIITSLDFVVNP
jgi:hypothetical protein